MERGSIKRFPRSSFLAPRSSLLILTSFLVPRSSFLTLTSRLILSQPETGEELAENPVDAVVPR
jgi:hypothetical protein